MSTSQNIQKRKNLNTIILTLERSSTFKIVDQIELFLMDPSAAHSLAPGFSFEFLNHQFSVNCFVDRCLSCLSFFLLTVALSLLLRITAVDYHLCNFQTFVKCNKCRKLKQNYKIFPVNCIMLNPKCFYTLLDGISNKTQYNHIERV